MNDQLVSFEVASLLKENGFDGKSFYHYFQDGRKYLLEESSIHLCIDCERGLHTEDHLFSQKELDHYSGNTLHTLAPTQAVAQKWVFEKTGAYFHLSPAIGGTEKEKEVWICVGYHWEKETRKRTQFLYTVRDTYKEALDEGLKITLK